MSTSSFQTWLGRFGLSAAAILAMPLIFLVFNTVAGGLTPDNKCALCPYAVERVPTTLGPDDVGYLRAHVQSWVDFKKANLPTITSAPVTFAWDDPEETAVAIYGKIGADDLSARYGYAVPTALLTLITVPIIFVVFLSLPGSGAYWRTFAVVMSGVAVAAGLVFQDSQPVRVFTAEYLLGRAALSDYPFLTPETWDWTFRIVNVVTAAGMTSTALLVVLFAWLASGPGPQETPFDRAALLRRTKLFKLALGLGSAVLILAVASTHGLFQWSPVLLSKADRPIVESLGSSASLYWGVVHSMTLLCVSVPAGVRLQLEIDRAAGVRPSPGPQSSKIIAKEVGFDFSVGRIVSTAMTVAAPLLTGPLLDLVRQVAVTTK